MPSALFSASCAGPKLLCCGPSENCEGEKAVEAGYLGVGAIGQPMAHKLLDAGSGRNSAVQSKFPEAVLTRSFDYGAEMHILMKDIDLAIAQGEELGVPMWVCQAARLVFKHAMHQDTEDPLAVAPTFAGLVHC
jgi:3-hydroxyisobutyrate dehydrogenase-like beta-hydroxyacid dehydrogenase